MLRGAAERHKRQFTAMLADAGQDILIQHPAVRVAAETAVDKVLGRRTLPITQTPTGVSYQVLALISTGYRTIDYEHGNLPASIAAVGRTDPSIVVARCLLSDVQDVGASPYGDTYFHGAARIVIGSDAFQMLGIDRTGLPPVGPYTVWVGLKRVGPAT